MPEQGTILRYRDAALALLPPGRAISKDVHSDFAALFEAFAVDWARTHEDAAVLQANIVPGASAEYLDLWERTLQLPSQCVKSPPTDVAGRLAAVRLHILGLYDHSLTGYQQAANALGYGTLGIVRYMPALCTGECTQPLYGDAWGNVITLLVTGPQSDTLTCIFVDQLRRSHAYVDVRYI